MARILLIDDSPLQLLGMSRILQALGHEVSSRTGPQESVLVSSPEAIDLVLIELLMRTGNGFEAALQLREAGYSRVLLLTGVYRETDAIWAQSLGICGVITRPLPREQLQKRIEMSLHQSASGQ